MSFYLKTLRVLNYTYEKQHYDVENSIRLISSVRSMEALEHYKIRQLMSLNKKYLADLSEVPQYKHFISVYNLLKDSRQAVMKVLEI